jgi:hypothetical protein
MPREPCPTPPTPTTTTGARLIAAAKETAAYAKTHIFPRIAIERLQRTFATTSSPARHANLDPNEGSLRPRKRRGATVPRQGPWIRR